MAKSRHVRLDRFLRINELTLASLLPYQHRSDQDDIFIQRSVHGDVVTPMLSGDIASDRAAELEAILDDMPVAKLCSTFEMSRSSTGGVRLLASGEIVARC